MEPNESKLTLKNLTNCRKLILSYQVAMFFKWSENFEDLKYAKLFRWTFAHGDIWYMRATHTHKGQWIFGTATISKKLKEIDNLWRMRDDGHPFDVTSRRWDIAITNSSNGWVLTVSEVSKVIFNKEWQVNLKLGISPQIKSGIKTKTYE